MYGKLIVPQATSLVLLFDGIGTATGIGKSNDNGTIVISIYYQYQHK